MPIWGMVLTSIGGATILFVVFSTAFVWLQLRHREDWKGVSGDPARHYSNR